MYVVTIRFKEFESTVESKNELQIYADGDTYVVREYEAYEWKDRLILNRDSVVFVRLDKTEDQKTGEVEVIEK